jgi:hypothetical protein
MVRSGTWTDRNKASLVLAPLTKSRNPEILARLKKDAWDALMEMARWRPFGWQMGPRMILARIAGLPEARAKELGWVSTEAFLDAIGQK